MAAATAPVSVFWRRLRLLNDVLDFLFQGRLWIKHRSAFELGCWIPLEDDELASSNVIEFRCDLGFDGVFQVGNRVAVWTNGERETFAHDPPLTDGLDSSSERSRLECERWQDHKPRRPRECTDSWEELFPPPEESQELVTFPHRGRIDDDPCEHDVSFGFAAKLTPDLVDAEIPLKLAELVREILSLGQLKDDDPSLGRLLGRLLTAVNSGELIK